MAADPLGGRGCAGQRARASGGASGAIAGLAADCGDRPGTAARWPHRAARVAQAAPPIGPGGDPDAEPAQPVATEAADGIVWLSGGSNREAGPGACAALR